MYLLVIVSTYVFSFVLVKGIIIAKRKKIKRKEKKKKWTIIGEILCLYKINVYLYNVLK